MPLPDGERLARLETLAEDVRNDPRDLHDEEKRARGRLHDLGKVTQGLVTLQREMHRANDARLARLTVTIQQGGLVIAAAVFALAIVTFVLHH